MAHNANLTTLWGVNLKIVDKFESNEMIFFTVELEDDVFVDVKAIGALYYVMLTDDGYSAYDSNGNSFDYRFSEEDVIHFVKTQSK